MEMQKENTFPIQYIKHTLQLENSLSNIKVWIYKSHKNEEKNDHTKDDHRSIIILQTRYNSNPISKSSQQRVTTNRCELTQRQHHFVEWQRSHDDLRT